MGPDLFNSLRGERREKTRRHLGGKVLEDANGSGDETVAKMTQGQVEYRKVPFRHHLNQPSRSQELRLNNGRKIADACAGKQRGREAVIFVDRQIRFECSRGLVFSARVNETPGVLRPPEREGQQPMRQQVLRRSWRFVLRRYSGLATS